MIVFVILLNLQNHSIYSPPIVFVLVGHSFLTLLAMLMFTWQCQMVEDSSYKSLSNVMAELLQRFIQEVNKIAFFALLKLFGAIYPTQYFTYKTQIFDIITYSYFFYHQKTCLKIIYFQLCFFIKSTYVAQQHLAVHKISSDISSQYLKKVHYLVKEQAVFFS